MCQNWILDSHFHYYHHTDHYMFNILKHLKQILTVCILLAITDCIFILLLENNNNDFKKKSVKNAYLL